MARLPLLGLLAILALHAHAQSSTAGVYYPNLTLATDPAPLTFPSDVNYGTCICDLTFARCDFNCYCDPDCTVNDIRYFTSPLPTGADTATDTITLCEGDELVRINSRGDLVTAFVDNVLCVVEDNNPTKGRYFHPPTSITGQQFDQYRTGHYDFEGVGTASPVIDTGSTTVPDNYYAFDPLLTTYNTAAGVLPVNSGRFPLPSPGYDGSCSDSYDVRYVSGWSQACQSIVTDIVSDCRTGTGLDLLSLLDNIRVFDSNAKLHTLTVSTVPVSVSPLSLTAPCQCANVINSLSLLLTYDGDTGKVIDIVANVSTITVIATSLSSTLCSPISVTQSFTVSWLSSNVTNSVARPKSGNPGYLRGLPIISGTVLIAGNVRAVEEYVSGLSSTDTGVCDSGSTVTVTFGDDLFVSCRRLLTLYQLQSFCQSNTVDTMLASYLSLHNDTVVGVWGNADLNNINHWLTIDNSSLSSLPSMAWHTDTQQCQNVLNSLSLELATVELGLLENAQSAIISARWTPSLATWSWTDSNINASRGFVMTFTVTFVQLPLDGIELYLPESEPLFPPLPRDLFYPLYIPSSAHGRSPSLLTVAVAVLVLVTMLQ